MRAVRVALHEHLATCQACSAVHSAYNLMEVRIRSLPAVEPLPHLPYQLLQREKSSATYKEALEPAFPSILTWPKFLPGEKFVGPPRQPTLVERVLKMGMAILSVVSRSIACLRVPDRVHATLVRLSRKVIYISSDDHYLYALRKDSGSFLWRHKKSEVSFSSPAVMNGQAYLTSLDCQVFLFARTLGLRPMSNSFLWKC